MQGRILALCVSEKKHVKKVSVSHAYFKENEGIVGDAHAGSGHRQVSFLPNESINQMKKKGIDLPFGAFAENVVVAGVDFKKFSVGDVLLIGRDVVVEITQIGKECHAPCEIYRIAGDCIMPKQGIFGKVLKSGDVKVSDTINIQN